jgi:hypothetical protein
MLGSDAQGSRTSADSSIPWVTSCRNLRWCNEDRDPGRIWTGRDGSCPGNAWRRARRGGSQPSAFRSAVASRWLGWHDARCVVDGVGGQRRRDQSDGEQRELPLHVQESPADPRVTPGAHPPAWRSDFPSPASSSSLAPGQHRDHLRSSRRRAERRGVGADWRR